LPVVIDVVKNTVYITLVQRAKSVLVALRGQRQNLFVADLFFFRHGIILPAALWNKTPPDFRSFKYWEYNTQP